MGFVSGGSGCPSGCDRGVGNSEKTQQMGNGPGTACVFFDVDSAEMPAGKELLTGGRERVTKALGITGKTFHSLRHSFITHFGPHMRPAELHYLVGHSNEATTERYQHRTAESRKEIRIAQSNILQFPEAL